MYSSERISGFELIFNLEKCALQIYYNSIIYYITLVCYRQLKQLITNLIKHKRASWNSNNIKSHCLKNILYIFKAVLFKNCSPIYYIFKFSTKFRAHYKTIAQMFAKHKFQRTVASIGAFLVTEPLRVSVLFLSKNRCEHRCFSCHRTVQLYRIYESRVIFYLQT